MKALKSIDKFIDSVGSLTLFVVLMLLLFLSVALIVLRWFNLSFLWAEPLLRHLVFFSIFMGGVLATGKGAHIGIDLVSKFLESKKLYHWQSWIARLVLAATLVTLIWLTATSLNFVQVEADYPKEVFWGISSPYLVAIIPLGFLLIAVRTLIQLLMTLPPRGEE